MNDRHSDLSFEVLERAGGAARGESRSSLGRVATAGSFATEI